MLSVLSLSFGCDSSSRSPNVCPYKSFKMYNSLDFVDYMDYIVYMENMVY